MPSMSSRVATPTNARSRGKLACFVLTLCLIPLGMGLLPLGLSMGSGPSVARAEAPQPQPMMRDLQRPVAVTVGPRNLPCVVVQGEPGKENSGALVTFDAGKARVIADGFNSPAGIVYEDGFFYVTDQDRVWKVHREGRKSVLVGPEAFPKSVTPSLCGVVRAADGTLYVSDIRQAPQGPFDGAIYRISPEGQLSVVADNATSRGLGAPTALLLDGDQHLLAVNLESSLLRIKIADGSLEKIAEGFQAARGLARDWDGNLYISHTYFVRNESPVVDAEAGLANFPNSPGHTDAQPKVVAVGVPKGICISRLVNGKADPQLFYTRLWASGETDPVVTPLNICLGPRGAHIMMVNASAGTLTPLPLKDNNASNVDTTPLPVSIERAFPKVTVERPVALTHAGDGTDRVFIASQLGRIYVMPNSDEVSEPTLFLDLFDKVRYLDRENEQGLLGLAFHPRYKENGEFFVYYTRREDPRVSVISRLRVSKDDPNRADPASEEELLVVEQPYWNHNGGTLAFGPDGYLYIVLGDGGAADDPQGNGQNLGTLLGSVLRIDIDRKDEGLAYAVPRDNPFVGREGARGEIWAYGLRNVWRLAFDRATGDCWAADVGQNIWEEINLLTAGGNYGWNLREGRHRFQPTGAPPRDDLIEPIWEYHHDIGKSVTGGTVYRGTRVPELTGYYIYADYVSGQVWGLMPDAKKQQAVANRPINGNIQPVMSFGEDQQGELYFMTPQHTIYRFRSGLADPTALDDALEDDDQ